MSFYDDVMRQLIAALGAALFLGNLLALVRSRRSSAPAPPKRGGQERSTDLARAPVARTVLYMVLGFVVMVWGVASLLAS